MFSRHVSIHLKSNMLSQDCPEDDCGSSPNALGGKGLDVIVVFFDLKSDRSKRAA
jgi:hypothetical protein